MILRTWKVSIAEGRGGDLEEFARCHSLPMFESQPGCQGVFFTRAESTCVTVTLWDSELSASTPEQTDSYRPVVQRIEESGILDDDHTTERYTVYGGFLSSDVPGFLAHHWDSR